MPPRAKREPRVANRRRPAPGESSAPSASGSGNAKDGIFHFVNVNPSSDVQKSENRSVIRSHASKYIWRQHRAVRGDGAPGSGNASTTPSSSNSNGSASASASANGNGSSNSSAHSKPSRASRPTKVEVPIAPCPPASHNDPAWRVSPPTMIKNESTFVDSPPSTSTTFPADEDRYTFSESPEQEAESDDSAVRGPSRLSLCLPETHRPTGNPQHIIQGPFNQLIAWMEDPVFSSSTLGESADSKLLRYAAFDLWPGLVLGANGEAWGRDDAAKHWLPRARDNKALYTAFLYGAAGHMQTRKRLEGAQIAPQTREEKLEQIICESVAVKQLNSLMKDSSQATSDDIILAVLCMAFNRIDYSGWNTPDSWPKAPLRNLQWLDVYGGLSLNDQHIKGLLALIESKGGLDKMSLPGLAETISSANIMLSTKYLVKPRLPLVPVYKETLEGNTPGWPTLGPSAEELGLPNGDTADPISKAGLPSDLAEILKDMRDYNAVVNLYTQGLIPQIGLANLADRRNFIQYSLVSLGAVYEFHDIFFDAHRTYEACRLAAMVYGMTVVYPLPAANRPFRRLAAYLKAALIESNIQGGTWQSCPGMLLWVLVLGGMAARDLEDRPWFVSALRDTVVVLGVSTWAQLKDAMVSVMWMDSVCDMGGQGLWDDVAQGWRKV